MRASGNQVAIDKKPIQEAPVSHFKGEDDSVELGPEPEIGPVVTENTLVDEESRDS